MFTCHVLLNDCTFWRAFLQLQAASSVEQPSPGASWRQGCSCPESPYWFSDQQWGWTCVPIGTGTHTGTINTCGYVRLGTQVDTLSIDINTNSTGGLTQTPSSRSRWRSVGGSTHAHTCPGGIPLAAGLRHGLSPGAVPALRPPQLLAPGTQEQLRAPVFLQRLLSVLAGGRASTHPDLQGLKACGVDSNGLIFHNPSSAGTTPIQYTSSSGFPVREESTRTWQCSQISHLSDCREPQHCHWSR